jgi:hypothetical protein
MVGAFIYSRLANQTSAQNRVYPGILPQTPTFPAVTYQQISAVGSHAMGADSPLTTVRVQVDSWAKTYAEARTLAGEVAARLKRFRGLSGSIEVLDVLLDNELETYESTSQTRRILQDFTLFISNN